MNIAAIGNHLSQISTTGMQPAGIGGLSGTNAGQDQGFGKIIGDALQNINNLQIQADTASAQVASGQATDLHAALISIEEASLALQLTLQVRNKLVDSYQEIMRMPV